MPAFTPPTVEQGLSATDTFFGRYSIPVGQSVVKVDGTYQQVPYPTSDELTAAGTEGTDWFLGGRTYVISTDTAAALTADGFTVG